MRRSKYFLVFFILLIGVMAAVLSLSFYFDSLSLMVLAIWLAALGVGGLGVVGFSLYQRFTGRQMRHSEQLAEMRVIHQRNHEELIQQVALLNSKLQIMERRIMGSLEENLHSRDQVKNDLLK